MKIIISGYGKVGKVVEAAALAKGHEVIARIDKDSDWAGLSPDSAKGATVIEFSLPSTALANIRHSFDLGLPIVVGTTGWFKDLGTAREWCQRENQSMLYSANFSIGMNIFMEMNRKLARYLDKFSGYIPGIEEIHHIHKLDAPSGTAIKLAEDILYFHGGKKSWVNREAEKDSELPVISRREGEIPGIHIIRWESPEDSIEMIHTAHGRQGFAVGAILAAEWLSGKRGLFTMDDLLNFRD